MLEGEGEIGKRLDFLLQEMNRESNTVLSKTGGLGDLGLTITDLALAAKSEIDKIREQSLNLECELSRPLTQRPGRGERQTRA